MALTRSSDIGHVCGIFVVMAMFLLGFIGHVTSECATPGDGSWIRSSDDTVLTFTKSGMSGHLVSSGSDTTSYQCKTESGYNIYYAEGVQTNVDLVDIYICWKLVVQSANVILLYQLTEKDPQGIYPRYRVVQVDENDPAPAVNTLCSLSVSNVHPQVLYKVSSNTDTDIPVATLSQSSVLCAADLQATITYNQVGSHNCGNTPDSVDFCQDKMTARFDFSQCNHKPVFFSDGGVLTCLATYTKGGSTYTILGNQDATVDGTTATRFVCVKPTSATQLDFNKKDCSEGTFTSLMITQKDACPQDGAGGGGGGDGESGGSDLTPIIAGAVVGVLLIGVLIAVLIVLKKTKKLCFKKKRAITPLEKGSIDSTLDGEANTEDVVINKENGMVAGE